MKNRLLDAPPTVDLASATVRRSCTVSPATSGHNANFIAKVGDWTWEAVSMLCDIDVLGAADPFGNPAYLSFCHFRVRGGSGFHLRTPTFGDRLLVESGVFRDGSQSVVVLHHIASAVDGPADHATRPEVFHGESGGSILRIETFNRWVSRSHRGSNQDLVEAAPPGFDVARLPELPPGMSPRGSVRRARQLLTFLPADDGDELERVRFDYPIDPSRDLNAVGLLYFATYFCVVDHALLRLWRTIGRPVTEFLDRVVVDQQLSLYGNADADETLLVDARRRNAPDGAQEVVDVVARSKTDGRIIAVATVVLQEEER